jgi:hypothetical protein
VGIGIKEGYRLGEDVGEIFAAVVVGDVLFGLASGLGLIA